VHRRGRTIDACHDHRHGIRSPRRVSDVRAVRSLARRGRRALRRSPAAPSRTVLPISGLGSASAADPECRGPPSVVAPAGRPATRRCPLPHAGQRGAVTVDEHSREITRGPTTFHWGRYEVATSGGEIVALEPDPADPDPSPIGPGVAEADRAPYRITRPMVRE